jgi:hypothetical protein
MPPKNLDKKWQSWQHCEFPERAEMGRNFETILLPLVFPYEKTDFPQIFIDTKMFGKNWYH